jgi:tight adherence protein B
MDIPIRLIIFLSIVSIIFIELVLYAFRALTQQKTRQIQSRLKNFSFSDYSLDAPDILRKRILSNVPFLNKVFFKIPGVSLLDKFTQQANAKYPIGVFILFSLLLLQLGYLAGNMFLPQNFKFLSFAVALCSGVAPFLYLLWKKINRVKQFEKQLPEALDLIARSLRAGHAFTSGMKVVVDNFGDPLGPEFAQAVDEINFGVPVADALKNLAYRVDCTELQFFIVAVILQRETGGNLAEIIDNISHIIRERFKFNDRVRVLSAEGKLSAGILILLPFIIIFLLRIFNPKYMNLLFEDPLGRKMLLVAGTILMVGAYIMKRMIDVRI